MQPLNEKSIVFVSDFYADEFSGGAEMTTEALLNSSPLEVIRLKALDVSSSLIQQHRDKLWIFGNFTRMKYTLLAEIMRDLQYMVIEYDYKFCIYRSRELHLAKEKMPCDCHRFYGKTIASFFKNSRMIFWMSERQRKIYEENFITMREAKGIVLSSVFSAEDLDIMSGLRKVAGKREGWAILGAGSWIKGSEDAEKYCQDNLLSPIKKLARLKHHDLLHEMVKAEGFVFMPRGGDSCPRTVIEAKLLGCRVVTNNNVQHIDETWFSDSPEEIEQYLRRRPKIFWDEVLGEINRKSEGANQWRTMFIKTQ